MNDNLLDEDEMKKCAYKDHLSVNPVFACPQCGGGVTHRIKNYFAPGVRKDRSLYFCAVHAAWYCADGMHERPVKIREVYR